MLQLQNPDYKPPTGYAIWGNPTRGIAWQMWDCIEKLKTSNWFTNLRQYGIFNLEYRGWSMSPFILAETIHIILPSTLQLPGYPNNWLAYHDDDLLNFCYAVAPVNQPLYEMTIGVTHELVEALTDSPPGQGWTTDNAEAGDVCEETSLQWRGYSVASYWSNTHNRCFEQTDF